MDVTGHFNTLNKELQGTDKLITVMSDGIKAFKVRLRLWDDQLKVHNLVQPPHKKSLPTIFLTLLKNIQGTFVSIMGASRQTIPGLENYGNVIYHAFTLNIEIGNAPEKNMQIG